MTGPAQFALEHRSIFRHLVLQVVSLVHQSCKHEALSLDEPTAGGAAVDASVVAISSGRLRSAVGAGIVSINWLLSPYRWERNVQAPGMYKNPLSRIFIKAEREKSGVSINFGCKQSKLYRPCGMISWKIVPTPGK